MLWYTCNNAEVSDSLRPTYLARKTSGIAIVVSFLWSDPVDDGEFLFRLRNSTGRSRQNCDLMHRAAVVFTRH